MVVVVVVEVGPGGGRRRRRTRRRRVLRVRVVAELADGERGDVGARPERGRGGRGLELGQPARLPSEMDITMTSPHVIACHPR